MHTPNYIIENKAEIYTHLLTKKEVRLALWLISNKKRPSLKKLFLLYISKKKLSKEATYLHVFREKYSRKKDHNIRNENRLLINTIVPAFGFYGEVHPMKDGSPFFVLIDRLADTQHIDLFEIVIKKAIEDALNIDDFKTAGNLYLVWMKKAVFYRSKNTHNSRLILDIGKQAKQSLTKHFSQQIRRVETDEASVFQYLKSKTKAELQLMPQKTTIDISIKSNNCPASIELFHITNFYKKDCNSITDLKCALEAAKQSKHLNKDHSINLLNAFLAHNYHNNYQLEEAIFYYELTLKRSDLIIPSNIASIFQVLLLALIQNGEFDKANALLKQKLPVLKIQATKREIQSLNILNLCLMKQYIEASSVFPKDLKADCDSWYYQQNRLLQTLIWFHTQKKELAYNAINLLTKHFSYTKKVTKGIKNDFNLLKYYMRWQDAVNIKDKNKYLNKLKEQKYLFNAEGNLIKVFVYHSLKESNLLQTTSKEKVTPNGF